jgi:hypothetical protein
MFENQFIGKDKYIRVVGGQLKYLIEDFENLEKCFVFATKEEKLALKDLISSDYYSFNSYQGNNYIEFSSGFPIDQFVIFKIVRPLDLISIPFQFDTISSITPSSLNSNFKAFETLCLVMQETFNDRTFRIDGTNEDVMLPKLKDGEVWQRKGDGWQGVNIEDIEANIEKFWIEFNQKTKEILENIALTGSQQEAIIIKKGKEIEMEIVDLGENYNEQIYNNGNAQVDRINATSSQVDLKLDTIWRMYSIITGSNRYLSGNSLETRTELSLEREAVGGNLSSRQGVRSVYNGGNLIDRNIII